MAAWQCSRQQKQNTGPCPDRVALAEEEKKNSMLSYLLGGED